MTETRLVRALLRAASAVVLAFLYLPLIVLGVYAFNESRIASWPPTGFTLHWFGEAAANPAIRTALLNSFAAASASTAIALVLGTLAAIAVQRNEFFGKTSVSFLLVLPIALPGVITGIALQTSFKLFGFDFGLLTIIIGQATFCVVVAYNNVVARLRRLPIAPEEAAADLGATLSHEHLCSGFGGMDKTTIFDFDEAVRRDADSFLARMDRGNAREALAKWKLHRGEDVGDLHESAIADSRGRCNCAK